MVATSFDSKDELRAKHWSSVEHLEELKRLGCTVLHDVDVYDMHEHAILSEMKFDRIVYNFPHAGHDPMYCERHPELIRRHRELLAAFFTSSREMISGNGEIHVSHRNDYPYIRWKLKKLAKKAGLILIDMVVFVKADYPGYHNKRGGGIESNKTFPLKDCYTFKVSLPKCSEMKEGSLKSCSDQSQSMNKSDKIWNLDDLHWAFLQIQRNLQEVGIIGDPSLPTHKKGQENTKICSSSDNPIFMAGPGNDHMQNRAGLPMRSEMDVGNLKSGSDHGWSRNKSDKTSNLDDLPLLRTTFQVQGDLPEVGVVGDPSLPTHNKGQENTKICSGSDNPIFMAGPGNDHMRNHAGLPMCSETDVGSLKSGSDHGWPRNKSDKTSNLDDLPLFRTTFQVQGDLQEVGVVGDPSLPTHNKGQKTTKLCSDLDNPISPADPGRDHRGNHVGLPKCSETDEGSSKSGSESYWQNHEGAGVDPIPSRKKFIFYFICFWVFYFFYISQSKPNPS